MGAADASKAYLGGGRLAYGCTDLSTAWPHGGTGLGLVGDVVLRVPNSKRLLYGEDTQAPFAVQYLGGALVLAATIKGWDNDALAAVFPGTATGASGDKIVQWPGAGVKPGAIKSALSTLVFTPINPTHPSFVMYSAVSIPDAAASINLSAYRFLSVPAVFIAQLDSSDRLGAMGLASDLTL